MAFCTTCGLELSGDVNFCPECGAPSPSPTLVVEPKLEVRDAIPTLPEIPQKKRIDGRYVAACCLAMLAMVIGIGLSASSSSRKFQNAVGSCISSGESGYSNIQVASDGSSLYLDGAGSDFSSNLGLATELCILGALDMPSIILTRMNETNALMGVQTGEWDGITASWTYHPRNGLDVSLSKK